jgi:hypothetical protein
MNNFQENSNSDIDIKQISKEYDLYLLDRMAEELLGIKDLVLNANKIKKSLNGEK